MSEFRGDYQIHAGQAIPRNFAQPDSPPTMSPVQSSQAQLDDNVSRLHEAISKLAERLQPVLMPEPDQVGGKSGVRPVASTVSQRISESADGVSYAIERMRGLVDRLEV